MLAKLKRPAGPIPVPKTFIRAAVAIAIVAAIAPTGFQRSAHGESPSSGRDAALPPRIAASDAQRQQASGEHYLGMFRGQKRFGDMSIKTTHDASAGQYLQSATGRSLFSVESREKLITVKRSTAFSDQPPYALLTVNHSTEIDDKPKHSRSLRRV
ncbi:MAG TPA: hypothetical protein VGG30_00320, partial [Pirellulales bacterium]